VSNEDVLTRLSASLSDRYRIDRELGAGGMATVFLAHDLRHDRDVAIKVLHPDLGAALGGERFLSEIRTTARLQHPHVLPLLDSGSADGLLYYVMPLVTGETLRARLAREKQLPVDDATRIAGEVADALGYAHELGVIHRDIKPENILLQNGHATVADFGIALAVQQAGGHRMTQTGLSLGTPQYMSPEQAMGERTIDARSDLYALAAVTYEMLVGEPPFTGPTVQSILARVMTEDPRPMVAQRKAIPDHVEYAVMRGLEKLPADRWGSAREFAAVLQNGSSAPHGASATSRHRVESPSRLSWKTRLRDPLVLTLAAAVIASTAFATSSRRNTSAGNADVVRFSIPALAGERANSLGFGNLAISPDGRTLVYVGMGVDKHLQLMLRKLDDIAERPLPQTAGATNPIFSPDGKWIAFVRSNQVFKISIDGSNPQLLAPAPGIFGGMSWSSTGVIVVSGNVALYTISEAGGPPKELAKPDRSKGELYFDTPLVLDDAGVVIYSATPSSSAAGSKLSALSLKTGDKVPLGITGAQPLGVEGGVLTYVTTAGVIMGVPFDARKQKATGPPVQLVNDVAINVTTGLSRAALATNGTLFYQSGTQASQVMTVGLDGVEHVLLGEAREYEFPRLSPDGRRLAIAVGSDRRDIWLFDLSSQTMTRLTSDASTSDRPEWSPDGKRVLYRSERGARTAIWWRPADLSSDATPLVSGANLDVFEGVMSPDMKSVVYQLDTAGADIYYRGLAGQGDTMPHAVANSPAIEIMPRISPDGRWVAFQTDESTTEEIVVQPFPGPGGRVQVSSGGGSEPVWSRDGKRLFYRANGHLMAARIAPGQGFAIAGRDTLFVDTFQFAPNPHANYDVMADGTHFVFLKAASEGNMIVVTNWNAAVRARMASR
jgi:eukaryotic-like serine/threonine-protein kinase